VEPKAERRQFSAAYKLQIVREAEACKGKGEIGALLRREGLYASQLCGWRQAHRQGTLGAPRGRKPDPSAELQKQMSRLERDNERLRRKLQQAEAIIEVQKKVSEILGISLATPTPTDEES
jgi:transposase-like protein